MESVPYLALISALAGLGLAAFYFKSVGAASPGTDRMVMIMTEIKRGHGPSSTSSTGGWPGSWW